MISISFIQFRAEADKNMVIVTWQLFFLGNFSYPLLFAFLILLMSVNFINVFESPIFYVILTIWSSTEDIAMQKMCWQRWEVFNVARYFRCIHYMPIDLRKWGLFDVSTLSVKGSLESLSSIFFTRIASLCQVQLI